MSTVDDVYCLKVVRYGALGIEEASFHDHAIPLSSARALLEGHLVTLGPGDKMEVVLTRGLQRMSDPTGFLAETTPHDGAMS